MKLNLPYVTQLAILFALGQATRVVASPIPFTPPGTDIAVIGVAPVETHDHNIDIKRSQLAKVREAVSVSNRTVSLARRALGSDVSGTADGEDCDDEQVPVKAGGGGGGAVSGAGRGRSGGVEDDCEEESLTAGGRADAAGRAEDECEEEDIAPLGSIYTVKPPPAQQDLPGYTPTITPSQADKAGELDKCEDEGTGSGSGGIKNPYSNNAAVAAPLANEAVASKPKPDVGPLAGGDSVIGKDGDCEEEGTVSDKVGSGGANAQEHKGGEGDKSSSGASNAGSQAEVGEHCEN